MTEVDDAPQRSPVERQVGIGLITLMVLSALIVVYGVVYLVSSWNGDEDRTRFDSLRIAVVFLMLPGVVVFFTARSARRRLKAQVVSARLYSILSGVFGMLAGIPLLTVIFGLLTFVAGLFTLVAALLLKKPVPQEAAS
jgi:lysylphosphatidylglycerol synthetase-like protein (DUF2156 family)